MCKDNVHLNNMGQMVMKEASDEDIVSGQLTITIHKILGLQNSCGEFLVLFFWNDQREIELIFFGHQTMFFLYIGKSAKTKGYSDHKYTVFTLGFVKV